MSKPTGQTATSVPGDGDAFDPRPVLRRLGHRPGVYRMLGASGEILYVGKARDLKKRVSSYFRAAPQPGKTGFLVSQVRDIEVTVTRTEAEALVLENGLIKAHKPRFNVLLKDDKSFPYIRLDTSHAFPRLSFYRGSKRVAGRLFGPYPNVPAVRATLRDLQRLFRIRPCEDSYFAHRSRPCLQYQIERCSAPCVGLISEQDYAQDLDHAIRFLEGRSNEIKAELVRRMEGAAAKLAFEEAARYRDQVARLAAIQEAAVGGEAGALEADALAVIEQGGLHCVAGMFIRGGRIIGSRSWFLRAAPGTEPAEVLGAFVAQHYLGGSPPAEILTSLPLEDEELLSRTLSEQAARQVAVRHRVRAARARWLDMAGENARHALELRLAGTAGFTAQLAALGEALGLEGPPARIECFDVSHTAGESTVAACVVFAAEGPLKSDYRRFNIAGVAAGDDYAALRQALMRRYSRLKRGEAPLPDLLLVDGGAGQLAEAQSVLNELQLDGVELAAVAKGPTRRPGLERLFLAGQSEPLILPRDSGALHLVQQIRDEAHRFAIAGHRQRRAKVRRVSALEGIAGLGPKRRRQLLSDLGGMQGVAAAGVEDLAKVQGISRDLARRIYDSLHPAD
ncbi:MAG TPA: excinuclease ABC subunit UvrC [Gammaproteobacteria bacterium]|nr:excinuclease ABC subunit UvrC [Gammaproteobacteria bacterium]